MARTGGTVGDADPVVLAFLSRVGAGHGATANSLMSSHSNWFGNSQFPRAESVPQSIGLRRESFGEAE